MWPWMKTYTKDSIPCRFIAHTVGNSFSLNLNAENPFNLH